MSDFKKLAKELSEIAENLSYQSFVCFYRPEYLGPKILEAARVIEFLISKEGKNENS